MNLESMKSAIKATENEPAIKEKRKEVIQIMMKSFNKCGVKIPQHQKVAFEEALWLTSAFMSGQVPASILNIMGEVARDIIDDHIPHYEVSKARLVNDVAEELGFAFDPIGGEECENMVWLAYLKGACVSTEAYAKELLVAQVMLEDGV